MVARAFGQVLEFVGLVFEIEELAGLLVLVDELPAIAPDHALAAAPFRGEGLVVAELVEGEILPAAEIFGSLRRARETVMAETPAWAAISRMEGRFWGMGGKSCGRASGGQRGNGRLWRPVPHCGGLGRPSSFGCGSGGGSFPFST